MKRGALPVLLLLACFSSALPGQQGGRERPLSNEQKLGQRTFQQRCSICHTQAMVISKPFGPLLNKEIVEGRENAVRTTILEGITGMMPGFRNGLDSSEINAIIEYLKTVEKPTKPIANWTAEH